MTSAHDPAEPGDLQRDVVAEDVGPGAAVPVRPRVPWQNRSGRGPATLIPVVCGVGADAWAVADTVAEQCGSWVEVDLIAIDDCTPAAVEHVPGLVIVLSSETTGGRQRPRFRELRELGEHFRAQRPLAAADAFQTGSTTWYKAGVLWVLYTDDALRDPDARALIQHACASYSFAPGVPFTADLFEIYEPGVAAERRAKDPAEMNAITNWNWLGGWGIHDVGFATVIKQAIDARCRLLDDASKPKMFRPIPGVSMNRLELLLFQPARKPDPDPALSEAEQKKELTNFTSNGARAVREHLADLVATFENTETPFRRPATYENRRDQQTLYRKLYLTLRAVIPHA